MILRKNTYKNLPNLASNRLVYQEVPEPQVEVTPKEIKEADSLAAKKQNWDFRADVKPAARKKIERNPWTDKDQKNYDQLLAKMTDSQQTEHYNKLNKRAERFLGSEKIKEGQIQEADYAVKTTEQMADADRKAAKKQLAQVTGEILKEPEVVSEGFSAKKKEQALKLVADYNGKALAKLFGGSPKKLVGSTDKSGLIKMIEGKGFTNDQARQIESVIYNATKAPFRLPNGKKVSQMEYYKNKEAREKKAAEVAKLDLESTKEEEVDLF